jgi:hypothetical protein
VSGSSSKWGKYYSSQIDGDPPSSDDVDAVVGIIARVLIFESCDIETIHN